MVRLFFLALASMVLLACSREEPRWNPVPPDSPAGIFAAEVEAYYFRYEAEFNDFNVNRGMELWDGLAELLYRDIRAWEWLQKDKEDGWTLVTLKQGTKWNDLPLEVKQALQMLIEWEPYGPEEESEFYYGFSEYHIEYLTILFDLLGGDHPIWERYAEMFALDVWDSMRAYALTEFLDLILKQPHEFPPALIQRVKQAALDRRYLTPTILNITRLRDWHRHNSSAPIRTDAEVWWAVGRSLMDLPPSRRLSLDQAMHQDFVSVQLALEEKAAQLP